MTDVTMTQVDCDGFQLIAGVLDDQACHELADALGPADGAGQRGLLSMPAVAALTRSQRMIEIVRPYVGPAARPVRAIYFDKSPNANWLVPWHQDLTIAVRQRVDAPGFGPWSVKDGVPHVQPPAEIMARMIAVRLHLDPADEANGALRVLAGSHLRGRLTAEQIATWSDQGAEVVCTAAAGDALLMRPLLLHASSKSTSTHSRRVLHIEYAGFDLPEGMQWNDMA
jgi:hypothetical protein